MDKCQQKIGFDGILCSLKESRSIFVIITLDQNYIAADCWVHLPMVERRASASAIERRKRRRKEKTTDKQILKIRNDEAKVFRTKCIWSGSKHFAAKIIENRPNGKQTNQFRERKILFFFAEEKFCFLVELKTIDGNWHQLFLNSEHFRFRIISVEHIEILKFDLFPLISIILINIYWPYNKEQADEKTLLRYRFRFDQL